MRCCFATIEQSPILISGESGRDKHGRDQHAKKEYHLASRGSHPCYRERRAARTAARMAGRWYRRQQEGLVFPKHDFRWLRRGDPPRSKPLSHVPVVAERWHDRRRRCGRAGSVHRLPGPSRAHPLVPSHYWSRSWSSSAGCSNDHRSNCLV